MNAIDLFNTPHKSFHSAESFWSSWFALFLKQGNEKGGLPLYNWDGAKYHSEGTLPTGPAAFDYIVAGGAFNGQPFSEKEWPSHVGNLKPDVVAWNNSGGRKEIWLIEIKTIGTELQRNFDLYPRLRDHLKSEGWDAKLIYLLSDHHHDGYDWKLLSQAPRTTVLIWEHVFREAHDTFLGKLISPNLKEYAEEPASLQK